MRIVYFSHSIASCWNHGNAHFQRGLMRALIERGHQAIVYEPEHGWSRANLARNQGDRAIADFEGQIPGLVNRTYHLVLDLDSMLDGADLVIVHEWTDPEIISAIGRHRRNSDYRLLFHDTHHRVVSDPAGMPATAFEDYDGVLAFGESLAELYRRLGWGRHCFVFHEAADTGIFRPISWEGERKDLVWIGNWGDGERNSELAEFLFEPVRAADLDLTAYGVRYPEAGLARLASINAHYAGWLPNIRVPEIFARYRSTVHVPRRAYRERLPGIPTIRIFEALACGIPLVSAPWEDREQLFRPGEDFLVAQNGAGMACHLRDLKYDADLRTAVAASGLARIRERHSCAHRADELLAIVAGLQGEIE